MPWHLEKVGGGYKVVTNASGREHSKKPLKKEVAIRQLAALHMNVEHKEKKK